MEKKVKKPKSHNIYGHIYRHPALHVWVDTKGQTQGLENEANAEVP